MGEYNPDAGLIVGQEWVPIVNDPYALNPSEEIGWRFDMPSAEVVSTGKIYTRSTDINVPLAKPVDSLYVMMALYPTGLEASTGPLRQSIVEISGAAIDANMTIFPTFPVTSATEALYYPNDSKFIQWVSPGGAGQWSLTFKFNFSGHPELDGKRIIKMELLLSTQGTDGFIAKGELEVEHCYGDTPATLTFCEIMADSGPVMQTVGVDSAKIPGIPLANINVLYDDQATHDPFGTSCFPWTYPKLLLLDNSFDPNKQSFSLLITSTSTDPLPAGEFLNIYYAALRVTYCEEQRLAFGGVYEDINANSTPIDMRSPNLVANSAIVPAGSYALTVEGGKLDTTIFASRELYQLPGQRGIVVDRTDRVGETFHSHTTDQLVMLSIHEPSGDIIQGPHGYGPQEQADSYAWPSTTQTSQGIINNSENGTLTYPTARFYARRFGDTIGSLSLTSDTNPAVTASITVAEFDALPEITDGWRQVDLLFTGALPTFDDSGTTETYYWSSTTPNGDGWQILIASSVAKDNAIPANYLTGADAPLQNNYGADMAFARVDDLPQVAMDATLMFAQAMPAVSGLALTNEILPVTGIGLDCGLPPDCVPTGISYHSLTWLPLQAVSVPASGFGYYELQRSDDIDTTWNTILQAFSPLVTGFSDFEARTGIESHYRIRFQHRLLFPSAWSPEVDGTIPAPGVTGSTVNNGNGVLIFTSNERQTGSSSLAYAMVWENKPEEGFTFVEAGDRTLQQMYGRDYQVAFRPLERGGEAFSRTLLVQAAAVPDGLIQHGFTSLRDLAWRDLSYVCVRDELGDRWLSNVNVPDGEVERNRRLYMAQVDITEVTATPSIVTLPDALMGSGGTSSGCIAALWDGLPGWDYGCWS